MCRIQGHDRLKTEFIVNVLCDVYPIPLRGRNAKCFDRVFSLNASGGPVSVDDFNVFIPILVLIGLAICIVLVSLLLSKIIRPHRPSKLKQTAYECGELPQGSAWSSFNVRFYVVGLIFIIFDVESALMFPVASVYKKMLGLGRGGLVLVEIAIFLGILVAGIAYCWAKGDLDWVKSYRLSDKDNARLKERGP